MSLSDRAQRCAIFFVGNFLNLRKNHKNRFWGIFEISIQKSSNYSLLNKKEISSAVVSLAVKILKKVKFP